MRRSLMRISQIYELFKIQGVGKGVLGFRV
jgi:hypothetical protein